MAIQPGHIIKDDNVYDADGTLVGRADVVYGGYPKGGMTAGNDSQATSNAQPSKNMNSGSVKIDGANPSSPSTNPATRSAEYKQFQQIMANQKGGGYATDPYAMYNTSNNSNTRTNTSNFARPETLGGQNGTNGTSGISGTKTQGLDLTPKGNFDIYSPIDRENKTGPMQQYYLQANNDLRNTRRSLSQLILQQDALNDKSSNVNEVTTLIDAIENAYDKGVFDTNTIASQLGVSPEAVALVQQGKANELVKLNEDYVKQQMKGYYRAEEDYDIQMQRTMEDYQLAKTNMDNQYNSAMQTLRRNLFDSQWSASVGGAVAGISGSEYALQTIEAKHNQALNDLNNNYLYSSTTQKLSYTRAIQDYNKNIERLSQDFDDDLKKIQAGVLQQFQEIDSKIGLTTQQLANIYGTLEQNVISAKSGAVTSYINALSNGETTLANAIAQITGLDTNQFTNQTTQGGFTYNPISQVSLQGGMNQFIANLGDKIENHAKIRSGGCGTVCNDYLKSLGFGTPIGDSKTSKLALINNNVPTVGSIAIRDKTGTEAGNKYGHVAIVTSVNDDGTVTVLESNADTGLRYHTYKAANITGFFDPSQGYGDFEKKLQEERLQSIYNEQAAKESAKTTTQTTSGGNGEVDYSGLTPEQIYDVNGIVTDILGGTQAGKDTVVHNVVAQMMREGKTTEQIKKGRKDRLFGEALNAYPETKAITQFLGSSLTKAQKEDFQDSIKDAISNNNPQEAFSFIKTTIKNNMNADDKKKTAGSELAKMHLLEIQELYDQFIAAGGETGWLSGEYEEMLQKFGKTSDPKLLEISNKIARAIQSYRHDISGAAFTESEAKEYKKVFPGIEQDEEVFRTNLKSGLDYADNEINYYYDTQLGGTGKYKALQEELSKVRTPKSTITEEISKTNQINLSNLKDFASNVYTMLFNNKQKDTDPIIVEETPSATEEQVTSEFGIGGRMGRGGTTSSGTTYTGTFAPHF